MIRASYTTIVPHSWFEVANVEERMIKDVDVNRIGHFAPGFDWRKVRFEGGCHPWELRGPA